MCLSWTAEALGQKEQKRVTVGAPSWKAICSVSG